MMVPIAESKLLCLESDCIKRNTPIPEKIDPTHPVITIVIILEVTLDAPDPL